MNSIINDGRASSFHSLDQALKELKNTPTTEKNLCDKWLSNLSVNPNVISEGWYNPPPNGTVILAANESDGFDRFNFLSLRNKETWSNNTEINWNDCLIYCYSSPVCKKTGSIADFSTTIYLGSNKNIKEHFRNCYQASCKSLDLLNKNTQTSSFFSQTMEIFREHDLEISGSSITDLASINLGHSFSRVQLSDLNGKSILTDDLINYISKSRKFINNSRSWDLSNIHSFSFEPRLRSSINSGLPQVSLHFLVSIKNGKSFIQHDCDNWWQEY